MLTRIDHNGITWVDAHNPSREEISKISEEFRLNEEISSEISRPSFHPKVQTYGDKLYLILPLPLYDHRLEHHHSRELDIVVSEKYILTVHYEKILPVHEIFTSANQDLNLRKELFSQNSHRILYRLWKNIYDHLLTELDHIQKKIDRIEDRIFSIERRELIEEISLLRRDILDFSRALRPHGMVIDDFSPLAHSVFGADSLKDTKELFQNYKKIILLADNNKDALEILYDTYNALQNRRSSETMRIFTMLALMTFPLTLIAAIFAIETKSRPIVGQPNDFWMIIGLMVLVLVGMLIYFKRKKWL